jgi:hypothetical protein
VLTCHAVRTIVEINRNVLGEFNSVIFFAEGRDCSPSYIVKILLNRFLCGRIKLSIDPCEVLKSLYFYVGAVTFEWIFYSFDSFLDCIWVLGDFLRSL